MDYDEYNKLSNKVIEACIFVHKTLGPGLLESIYEDCLIQELKDRNISFRKQQAINVIFKEKILDKHYVIDLIIEDRIILELKAVDTILPVHEAQLLTYLKITGKWLGLLINFNTPLLKDGIRRKVNGSL